MGDLVTIILAAGKGTRMKSHVSKVLHAVCGKRIIEYVLDLAMAVGSKQTYVVLGHQRQELEAFLKGKRQVGVVAQKKLLGTADAVKSARGVLKGSSGHVLILSGDAILLTKPTVRNLIQTHIRKGADCTFLTAVVHEPHGYGRIIRSPGGKAVAIREEKDAFGFEKSIVEINVGVYCFKSDVLFDTIDAVKMNPLKGEYYLTDLISLLAERKRKIETCEVADPDEGLGINTRADMAKAEKIIQGRILKDFMSDGVTIVDPQNTYIAPGVKIGRDTVIYPFTFIEEDVRIGIHCRIGPFAHLRPGTRIKDEAQVGNFAEISRSVFGPKSIMKHFGFLGDTHVGAGVNIGAGVVTANYDGKNKNKTIIADEAFIGSDSILVAPVKVGKRAITGAGCVVTRRHHVPAGKIVAGVPARVVEPVKTRRK